jgi:hypothetical protein
MHVNLGIRQMNLVEVMQMVYFIQSNNRLPNKIWPLMKKKLSLVNELTIKKDMMI